MTEVDNHCHTYTIIPISCYRQKRSIIFYRKEEYMYQEDITFYIQVFCVSLYYETDQRIVNRSSIKTYARRIPPRYSSGWS